MSMELKVFHKTQSNHLAETAFCLGIYGNRNCCNLEETCYF